MKNWITLLLIFFVSEPIFSQDRKPNIIYIMADDLGYGDIGCYGQTKIKTPEIDKMASEGMLFTQHYAGSTVCMPSRAVLMTGKHTGRATVRGNPTWTATGVPINLDIKDVTIADELKRAGYHTAIIGKWGLSEGTMDHMPLNHGFDYFFGYKNHRDAHHYYYDTLWRNNKKVILEGNDPQNKKGKYTHDLFAAEALNYIREQKDNPFFLYVAFTVPHLEMTVPEESKEKYKNLGWPERKMKMGHYRNDPEGHTTYAGMISRMDKDVGEILALLKELKIEDNTLVVFTSDNGHEFDNGFFNSNGPLKGGKRDLYEGGIRVPFIAKWSGQIQPGSVTDHISAFWDFLPTACEMAGISPTDKKINGLSYLPTLRGQNSRQKDHRYLYWEFNEKNGPCQAVRKENWKLVKYDGKPFELYDLSKDIGEKNDLAAMETKKLKELKRIMKNARTEHIAFPLTKREINMN